MRSEGHKHMWSRHITKAKSGAMEKLFTFLTYESFTSFNKQLLYLTVIKLLVLDFQITYVISKNSTFNI